MSNIRNLIIRHDPARSQSVAPSDAARSYAWVVLCIVLTTLLRFGLNPILHNKATLIVYFPALVASAWLGGFRGGLFALVLSTLAATYFFTPPYHTLRITSSGDRATLLVFVIVGLSVSALSASQRQARAQAQQAAEDAQRSAEDAQHRGRALEESEARKAAILEAALDCIISMDDLGYVIEWNPAAEQTFGYPRAAAIGQFLADLIIPPALRAAHVNGLARFLATGAGPVLNTRIEVPALNADGREFPVELAVIPIPADGRTLFTAYLRDLSDRERAAAQQRVFLRDVLLSVTEGRLRLCHLPADLPETLASCGEGMPLSRSGGIAELRRQSKQAAIAAGYADDRWQDLITAADEAAMNAVVHGGGGQGRVCAGADTIQVWVEDQGAGIDVANLPQATLEKGYSSAGTLGHGMKMMLSMVDRMWLLTSSLGTTVVLEQDRLPSARHSLLLPGEDE